MVGMIGIFIIYNEVDYLFASWHIFRTERGGREIGAIQAINKWTSQRDSKAHAYAESYLKITMFKPIPKVGPKCRLAFIEWRNELCESCLRIYRTLEDATYFDDSNFCWVNEDKLNFDINEHWRTSCNGNPSIKTSIIDDSFFRDHPHL